MRGWSVRSFISTARVIGWCARHRLHPHNPFPFHFCGCHLPHQVQVCYATIYLNLAKIRGRVADSRISTPPQVLSQRRSSLIRISGPPAKYDDWWPGLHGGNQSGTFCRSTPIFDVLSLRLGRKHRARLGLRWRADTQNAGFTTVYTRPRGKWRTKVKLVALNEKPFWPSLLGIPELQGNMMRCFHVTMSPDLLTRQVLGNHFLMEARIICLIKQDLNELMRQEHQVGSRDNCIEELQQQAYTQRLELEVAQHGNIESRQEQTTLQEELTVTEKVFRKTQIRNVH